MTSYTVLQSPRLGDLLLTANSTHLTGIFFADRRHAPVVRDDWELNPRHAVLQSAADQLQGFLDGERKEFSLPLHADGTAFQREIWRQIAMIPFGQTITYTELAKRAGAPHAVRAAGTATGRNPLSIVVPCHRVMGRDGFMRGYAGGLDRKQTLLGIEMTRMPALFGV